MSEDRVLQALRALAESDYEREAPPAVEARVLREFPARRAGHKWRWAGIAAITAGVVLAVTVWVMSLPVNHVTKPVVSVLPPVIPLPRPVARSLPASLHDSPAVT